MSVRHAPDPLKAGAPFFRASALQLSGNLLAAHARCAPKDEGTECDSSRLRHSPPAHPSAPPLFVTKPANELDELKLPFALHMPLRAQSERADRANLRPP